MARLETIEEAYLLVQDDRIAAWGHMQEWDASGLDSEEVQVIDASGRLVLPAFCDSHTHIVYAGSRDVEYIDKIKGLSYEEIAQRGGGILNSAARRSSCTR